MPFPTVLLGGLKLIRFGVHGVHLDVPVESIPNDEIDSADGLPLYGWISRSKTSSFSIKTLRPRRRARAPELLLLAGRTCDELRVVPRSSDTLEEETGELARVLDAEFWLDLPSGMGTQ